MNREEFYDYILNNFELSGEAMRLVGNILRFVEANYPDANDQYHMLCSLLDGAIGLSDRELRKVSL